MSLDKEKKKDESLAEYCWREKGELGCGRALWENMVLAGLRRWKWLRRLA